MDSFNPARLRTLRQQAGITIAELANDLGVSATQVHRLETNQRRLTVDMLLRITNSLGVNVPDLFSNEIHVPVIGVIDAADDVTRLPPDSGDWTLAPHLVHDMENVAAVRWEPKRTIEWMFGHLLFFYTHDDGVPEAAWGERCLITRDDGSQCIGWPVSDNGVTHIDSANGRSTFNASITWASPILAVVPPYLIERLKLVRS